MKGLNEAVEVYELVGAGAARSRLQAARERGHRWRSLQPAFSWGWRHQAARRRHDARRGKPACWVWLEQDRALVAFTLDDRITALNPGAPLPADDAALQRVAARNALRFGVTADVLPVALGGWTT